MVKGKEARAKKRRGEARKRDRSLVFGIAVLVMVACLAVILVGRAGLGPSPPAFPPSEEVEPTSPTAPPAKVGVAIVDQFYSRNSSFTDEAVRLLEGLGVRVDVYRDSEVTVELYRKLPLHGYRLIILRVHAGIFEGQKEGPTFLFTAEPYKMGKYVGEQLTDQINPGVINPYRPDEPVFTVGPNFVKFSMEGNFQGATIILSSCFGLYTPLLAEALHEKGASAFISWDKKVSLEHTDEGTLTLLKAILIERLTIKEAVDKVMEEVGPDPMYNCVLRYYPPESGERILQRL